ncbi:MAG: phosphoribosylaminoimidazolesuccinocarboxamide synthase [Bacteroidetes bacterium]|nr:phosphoribosylaminoimidazolesuccinocarboxamide synthase [Bacteroidota bacterium]
MTLKVEKGLMATNYFFKDQTNFYRGKVRDVYTIKNDHVVMIACDRISAFDHVLPRAIPHKGEVLTQIASFFLDATKDIIPNWKLSIPDPNVTIGVKCDAIPIEIVVRGYLCGHAWRVYKTGERMICGVRMPDGLKENDKFPTPIITPATKSQDGHDEDISLEEILARKIISKKHLDHMVEAALKLFERGSNMAAERGLILVDTKYEFGLHDKKLMLIDEVHTPDSSRFFYLDSYENLQKAGKPQKQLSKEFVREWLMANGFQGLEGQLIPEMTDEFVASVTDRYTELYEAMTGQKFEGRDYADVLDVIEKNIASAISSI